MPRSRTKAAALAAFATIAAAGCGGSSSPRPAKPSAGVTSSPSGTSTAADPNAPETNPAGDIPDNQAYVRYAPPGAKFSLKVPEGWARSTIGGATVFTDKLNTVRVEAAPAAGAPSAGRARKTVVPALASRVKGFTAARVNTVKRTAGTAVRITYLATGAPNPVTGKTVKDAVERYEFFHNGRDVVLTLSGPKGADNVDPWRIISNSVRWK